MNPQDYADIAAGLKARFDKDSYRIALFAAAVTKKTFELPAKDVSKFQQAAFGLIGEWADQALKLSNVKRWSFALFTRDPFADLRQRTRVFARTWALDPTFVEAMG